MVKGWRKGLEESVAGVDCLDADTLARLLIGFLSILDVWTPVSGRAREGPGRHFWTCLWRGLVALPRRRRP